MTLTWWQLALLISVAAFWTLFAVSLGVNTVNRTLAAARAEKKPAPSAAEMAADLAERHP
jgi:hypothetical protein